jgi:hypothetical protein
MNFVWNWKSRQLIKLFKIFKSSLVQSLRIFGATQGIFLYFKIWKSLKFIWKNLNWLGTTCQWPIYRSTSNTVTRSHARRHIAGHQVVTMLTAEATPPAGHIGHRRPTWVGDLIAARECRRGDLSHFVSSTSTPTFALLQSPLPAALLTVPSHYEASRHRLSRWTPPSSSAEGAAAPLSYPVLR